jgi:imidazolonepropionase
MNKSGTDSASGTSENARWTLIRGARQLLTLRGASGPRRGSAMSDLNIISDGALLIRDGIIEEVGATRRVENLVPARLARVIEAAGRVVMPAFVDPDIALAASPGGAAEPGEPDIRRMSRHRLQAVATALAADLARYGVLTIGAHTLSAPDLQNTNKALRLHQAMQARPLRIRSVFSPPCHAPDADEEGLHLVRISQVWMPAVFRKKLASVLEIPVISDRMEPASRMAAAAATAGYNIRFRVSGNTTANVLELAWSAGAVALIGPVPANSDMTRALGDAGCVKVMLTTRILAGNYTSSRSAIDDGTPIALASGYQHENAASINPQFLLYLACQALGMTAEEAIVATTYNAACSLRLSHVTGSLAPGKAADICMIDMDHYRDLARRAGHHDVCMVMRAGKVIYRRPNLTLE